MSTIFNACPSNTPTFLIQVNVEDGIVKVKGNNTDFNIQDNFDETFSYSEGGEKIITEFTDCSYKLNEIDKLIRAFQETSARTLQEKYPFCHLIYVEEKRILTATIKGITIPITIEKLEAFKGTDAIITEQFVYELI